MVNDTKEKVEIYALGPLEITEQTNLAYASSLSTLTSIIKETCVYLYANSVSNYAVAIYKQEMEEIDGLIFLGEAKKLFHFVYTEGMLQAFKVKSDGVSVVQVYKAVLQNNKLVNVVEPTRHFVFSDGLTITQASVERLKTRKKLSIGVDTNSSLHVALEYHTVNGISRAYEKLGNSIPPYIFKNLRNIFVTYDNTKLTYANTAEAITYTEGGLPRYSLTIDGKYDTQKAIKHSTIISAGLLMAHILDSNNLLYAFTQFIPYNIDKEITKELVYVLNKLGLRVDNSVGINLSSNYYVFAAYFLLLTLRLNKQEHITSIRFSKVLDEFETFYQNALESIIHK